MGYQQWKPCIDACLECAAICNYCANACTKEKEVEMMAECIRLDMECAAICYVSAQLMSLDSGKSVQLCKLCAELCDACGIECGKHNALHCEQCAEACLRCARECLKIAA